MPMSEKGRKILAAMKSYATKKKGQAAMAAKGGFEMPRKK